MMVQLHFTIRVPCYLLISTNQLELACQATQRGLWRVSTPCGIQSLRCLFLLVVLPHTFKATRAQRVTKDVDILIRDLTILDRLKSVDGFEVAGEKLSYRSIEIDLLTSIEIKSLTSKLTSTSKPFKGSVF
ncbi:hypothetical protein V1517DRAFT_334744 [Lipomyces orientalis]|uniref:Uncharacterized protein n=1 Tax=Lipomyces orientalis TaxID=1233043 RepID=A0ACC3TD06_9ASCO